MKTQNKTPLLIYFVIATEGCGGNIVGYAPSVKDMFINNIDNSIRERWTLAYSLDMDKKTAKQVYKAVTQANNLIPSHEIKTADTCYASIDYEGSNDLARHIALERLLNDSYTAIQDMRYATKILKKRQPISR